MLIPKVRHDTRLFVSESWKQNHKTTWTGMDPRGSSSPSLGSTQEYPETKRWRKYTYVNRGKHLNTSEKRLWQLKWNFILVHIHSQVNLRRSTRSFCSKVLLEIDAVSQTWGKELLVADSNTLLYCVVISHSGQVFASRIWCSSLVFHFLKGKAPDLDLLLGKKKKNHQQACPGLSLTGKLKFSTRGQRAVLYSTAQILLKCRDEGSAESCSWRNPFQRDICTRPRAFSIRGGHLTSKETPQASKARSGSHSFSCCRTCFLLVFTEKGTSLGEYVHIPLFRLFFFQYFISDRHLQRSIHRTKNIKIDLLSAYKRNI